MERYDEADTTSRMSSVFWKEYENDQIFIHSREREFVSGKEKERKSSLTAGFPLVYFLNFLINLDENNDGFCDCMLNCSRRQAHRRVLRQCILKKQAGILI